MVQRQTVWLITVFILLGLSFSGKALARTAAMQKPCANCHTMHMSQNGQPIIGERGNTERQDALMNDSCVGCHTTSSVGFDEGGTIKPFVWHIANPGYNEMSDVTQPTLAGGNFYWVAGGADLKGHNVEGIVAAQTSRTPPGGSTAFPTLRCAGENGCHGDTAVVSQAESIRGSHHSNAAIDGSSVAASYRMLNGVDGREDPDWEYTLAAGDRNQYKGARRIFDSAWSPTLISSFCARCHGNFHNDDGGGTGTAGASFSSPWIRHPVDIDIGGRTEYLYGGGGITAAFQVQTPLGSETFTPTPRTTLDLSDTFGQGIITCISCHRAHGSPYDYSLRWNYQAWPGAGYNGCGDCHTTKD
ncbi:MAG: cytochrome c3 family protein [Desulfurivibrionaceae bacterium]